MVGNGFQNIMRLPELKRRVLFTFAMLFVYRLGVHVPTPGIDRVALAALFARTKGTLFAMFDMFSGGAFEQLSVFALGIMPYISASIILQLLTVVIPHLERLSKEGEQGRRKITQYTRYGTVLLSVIQGFGIAVGLESMQAPGGAEVVLMKGWAFRLMTVITLTSGTAFIMWLGEQISERGIGNGISLVIFAGIVARMPAAVGNTFRLMKTGEMNLFGILILLVLMVAVIAFIIYVEQGQRRIPVHYAKRVVVGRCSEARPPIFPSRSTPLVSSRRSLPLPSSFSRQRWPTSSTYLRCRRRRSCSVPEVSGTSFSLSVSSCSSASSTPR